jgi:hypothetical protein
VASGLRDALDIALLAGAGWDLHSATFAPDRHHRLLGYRLCREVGCGLEPERAVRRLPRPLPEGGEGAGLDAFCRKGPGRKNRSRDRLCLVYRLPGFERPVTMNDLCAGQPGGTHGRDRRADRGDQAG